LGEDSIVGKSVAASASSGVMIPLTQIGSQIRTEGQHVDQQKLQSAYDYARKAVETSQLSEATALVKEFRSSDAYQWARGSRTTGTSGFDSSYREAVDHQSASENAYGRSRELTRAAQFMSEWSSGAQTDFTNYAARRLSERGLLREDDPIKLQRAVTEIAFGYAKGGDVGSQFVPGDSPLAPSNPLPQLLGWGSSTLRDDFNKTMRPGNVDAVRGQAAENAGAIRDGQSRQHATPGQGVGNDLAARIRATESGAATTIDSRRREVSQEQGALSGDYNAKVQVGKVSPNHTGNNAVWNTVGAQADNRAKLGTPPERPSIGEWHLNKDGVPATGPKAGSGDAAVSPDKPERSTKP
jgi:conjugal transfer mating pair stabilization protein TraG